MTYVINVSPGKRHLALWLFIILIPLAQYGIAQAAVGVEPPVELYVMVPGERVDGVIRVSNPTDTPINVRVYLADWFYDAEGTQSFLEPGSLPGSASPWISFSPSSFTLEGRQSTEVRYTAEVPVGVTAGTHWSMLFMEGENPNPVPGDRLATFRVRVGHTIYVNVAPIEKDGAIVGIFGIPPEDAASPYRFAIQYANTGNAAYAIEGIIEIRDSRGETVVTMNVDRLVVLPGSTRILIPHLYGPLEPGAYTMLAILNYGDRTKDIAGDYAFMLERSLEVLAPPDPRALGTEGSP